jgi:hypothetical protein
MSCSLSMPCGQLLQTHQPYHASRRSVGQADVFVHRQFRPPGRRIVSARCWLAGSFLCRSK